MKLSSLNKFKNKKVNVCYKERDVDEAVDVTGILEEVTQEYISIDYEVGLVNILITKIVNIEEAK